MLVAVLSVPTWGAVCAVALLSNTPGTALALAGVLVLAVLTLTT